MNTKRFSASEEAILVSLNKTHSHLLSYLGAAYLVNHKAENKQYIAKKVMLSGLKQKEKEGAMLEVNLLKNLDHPNIVAYK